MSAIVTTRPSCASASGLRDNLRTIIADKEYDVTRGQRTMDLIFEAQDGYLTAGAISDSEWQGMCRALNREDLIDDERVATAQVRGRNADERKQIVATTRTSGTP